MNEMEEIRLRLGELVLYFKQYYYLLLLSVGLPVANAPDVLQPCGLLYYP